MKTLPIKYLNECLSLDGETGVLTWKERPRHHFPTDRGWRQANGKFSGKGAGHKSSSTGYIIINFGGNLFGAHRVVYAMVYGLWPEYIDHIDGDRANNIPRNLRSCTRSQNQCNRPRQSNNKSGFKGVHRHVDGRWYASICIGRKSKFLGLFQTPEDAHSAYVDAAHKIHGEFARIEP